MKTRYTLLRSILSLSLLATLPTLAQQQEPAKSKTDTTVRRTYVIKEVNVKDKKREKKVQKKEIGREVVSDRDISRQFILSYAICQGSVSLSRYPAMGTKASPYVG